MSLITLTQLLTPVSEEAALDWCLSVLTSLGYPATSWQSGSRHRTMIQLFAKGYSAISYQVADVAAMGLNATAKKGWLTLLSKSHYDNDRRGLVKTQGTVVLTASASAPGPFTINTTTQQKVFADSVNGFTYRNITGGTLNAGGTLSVTVEAEVGGSNRDVSPNTITIMKTPLAGVTCNNPSSSWITRNGSDEESDETLRIRNSTKWGTLGIAPGMAYEHNALNGHESIRRVRVDDQNPRGPGTLNIWLAVDSGAVAPAVVTAVQNYMDGTTDGIDRIGATTDAQIASANALTINVNGTIYLLKQYDTPENRAAISAAVQALFQRTPVGGVLVGTTRAFRLGQLAGAIYPMPGVQNVVFTSPVADVPMTIDQVAVPAISFAFVQV